MYFVNVIFLVFACTYALSAQTEHRSVQTSESEDNYTFHVRQNTGDSRALVRCMNRVTTNSIDEGFRGDLTTNIDEHSVLSIDSADRELRVEHTGDQVDERQRVKELVARIKQCLAISEDRIE